MDSNVKLLKAIKSGEITPEQAVAAFERPAVPVHEIAFDFTEDPLNVGFPSIHKHNYFRANKPDLIVVAARPGVGKTSFVTQIAMNVARHSRVLMYSLEMSKTQLMARMASVHMEKPINQLNKLSESQKATLRNELTKYKLVIDDTNSIDLGTLINRTLAEHRTSPLSLVIVDYMQIIATSTGRSKAEEISKIAEKLKYLAGQINCPVLAVAQMNRNVESRAGNGMKLTPMMSDIADSAGIEKWSDLVMFLHRQYIYDKTRPGEADIIVAKNRNGVQEDFQLQFSGFLTKFFDVGI